MEFIVIEKLGGAKYASIITHENGDVMVFNSQEEAQREANQCQDGIVVRCN